MLFNQSININFLQWPKQ